MLRIIVTPYEEGLLCNTVSLYADDVILFLKDSVDDARIVKGLMNMFGGASSLCCNLGKSSISTILSQGNIVQEISMVLSCQVCPFPIRYMRLELSELSLTSFSEILLIGGFTSLLKESRWKTYSGPSRLKRHSYFQFFFFRRFLWSVNVD